MDLGIDCSMGNIACNTKGGQSFRAALHDEANRAKLLLTDGDNLWFGAFISVV